MTDTHHTRPGLSAGRCELMLGFPVPGWHIWPGGGYLIISRDVHLVRRGQVLWHRIICLHRLCSGQVLFIGWIIIMCSVRSWNVFRRQRGGFSSSM